MINYIIFLLFNLIFSGTTYILGLSFIKKLKILLKLLFTINCELVIKKFKLFIYLLISIYLFIIMNLKFSFCI